MSKLICISLLVVICGLCTTPVHAKDIATETTSEWYSSTAWSEIKEMNKWGLLPGFSCSISMDKALKIKLSRNGKEVNVQISRRAFKIGIQSKK